MGTSKGSPVRAFFAGAEIQGPGVSGPRLQTLLGLTPQARPTPLHHAEKHPRIWVDFTREDG
jgi:hypothetical protein